MRIGELSRRTGVPVPTIQYYLREGLLPPGELSRPNQARYDDRHVRRLHMIRLLVGPGGLTLAAVRDIVTAIDDPTLPAHTMLGVAHLAVAPPRHGGEGLDTQRARRDVDQLIRGRGWQIEPDAPGRDRLAEIIAAIRELGQEDFLRLLDIYADAAERIAAAELQMVAARTDPVSMVEAVVAGTVLADALLAALRRLAQKDASQRMFGAPTPQDPLLEDT